MSAILRIGTRASKLARAQAEMVAVALKTVRPDITIETVAMTTAGDRELHKQLTDWGYKGLFTKELEDAMLTGQVDIAVHSMKDMPSVLPEGLMIAAMLPRADTRDAWISPEYATLDDVPQGATIGTSSARRAAQLLHKRPDVKVVGFRGNVETRLRKLAEKEASATFLAAAGLQRLGLTEHIRSLISPDVFLPAVAQGAIGIECKSDRVDLRAMLAMIDDRKTTTAVTAERAMLRVLDGSCRTPIAGLAELDVNGNLTLRGEVLSLDGKIRHHLQIAGYENEAELLGTELGNQLRSAAGAALLTNA